MFDAYPHVYGGAARMMHLVSLGLRERGWQVEAVVPAEGPVADIFRADGITVTEVSAPRALSIYGMRTTGANAVRAIAALPAYSRRLAAVFRDRADVVQAITQRGVLLAGPAARLARVPLVWGIAGTEDSRAINLAGSLMARHLICVSRATLAENRGVAGFRRTAIVPNPFHPRIRPVDPEATARSTKVISAARLSPEKGVDLLLRAFARVHEAIPEATLTVLGAPQQGREDHAEELEAIRTELGLDGAATFAGFVAEPESQWQDAAVYVQPSRTEGMSLALVEAMAAGLPIVATNVGGTPEAIDHEVHGLLVPPEDVEGLAAAVERLLRDRPLAARLAAAARQRALDVFSAGRMVEDYAEVYERVIRRGPNAADRPSSATA